MKRKLIMLCGLVVCAILSVTGKQGLLANNIYDIKAYGAIGNGKSIDSKAINNAINAAAKAGGGMVYIPAGNYLSGSIHLQSNVSLYLEQGATIIAASVADGDVYDDEETGDNTIYQDSGHSHFHNSLIWGDNVHDISILGPGKIWGRGLLKDYLKGSKLGNKAIALYKCRNVIIKDISILSGGWFAILATGTDNLTISNVKLDTNRDGMDIDCCKNVRVSDCFVNSPYDDGICLKSSFALGYARSTENVTITNCQVSGFDEGTLLDGTYKRSKNPQYGYHPTGRIKFGTESNGGFQNVAVSNCVFNYCRGLALETVDGALLEDVTITNITMRDVVNDPIFLRLGARMRGPKETLVGKLRRVIISNVNVYNADENYTSTITGLPGNDIEDVQLSNITIYYKGGGLKIDTSVHIPEQANKYPEPGMFGKAPAYGFFIRHAKNIQFNNVKVGFINNDTRPAFLMDDVKGIHLFQVNAQKADGASRFELKNVSGFSIHQSDGVNDKELKDLTSLEL